MILTPLQKLYFGERVILKDQAKDVALGSTIGAVTRPIGSTGSSIAKGMSAIPRLCINTMASSTAGAASGAVVEGYRYVNGEKVTAESVKKSMAFGGVVGVFGGASAAIANKVSGSLSNGVSRLVAKVGT